MAMFACAVSYTIALRAGPAETSGPTIASMIRAGEIFLCNVVHISNTAFVMRVADMMEGAV